MLDFDLHERKFLQENISPEKALRKREVKDWLYADVLELKRPKWNASGEIPLHPHLEEPHARRLWHIKLGLSDGQNIKYSPNKIFVGTETRDDYGGWNPSTYFEDKERQNSLQKMTQHALQSTKSMRKLTLPQNYRSPKQRQVDYVEFIREQKVEEKERKNQLREVYLFENPSASTEKIDAGVFRLSYETKLKANQLKIIKENPNYSFRPEVQQTCQKKQLIKYKHTGIWSPVSCAKPQKDGKPLKDRWAWSCCMNDDVNSQGCNRYVQDFLKLNTVGFTND